MSLHDSGEKRYVKAANNNTLPLLSLVSLIVSFCDVKHSVYLLNKLPLLSLISLIVSFCDVKYRVYLLNSLPLLSLISLIVSFCGR